MEPYTNEGLKVNIQCVMIQSAPYQYPLVAMVHEW